MVQPLLRSCSVVGLVSSPGGTSVGAGTGGAATGAGAHASPAFVVYAGVAAKKAPRETHTASIAQNLAASAEQLGSHQAPAVGS